MVIYRLMALYSSLANILKLILSIQDLLVFIKKRMRSPIYKVQVMNFTTELENDGYILLTGSSFNEGRRKLIARESWKV